MTPARPYLFGLGGEQPLRDDQMLKRARAIGGNPELTVHGFRSAFKDRARNRTRFPDEVSELARAHVNSDVTRATYARDELLEQ